MGVASGMMIRHAGVTLLALLVLDGCAARPPPPQPAPGPPPASTAAPSERLASLEHALDTSEQRLDSELSRRQLALGGAEKGGAAASGAAPPAAPSPAPAPAQKAPQAESRSTRPSEKKGATHAGAATEAAAQPVSTCDLACRALASMHRSADGICSLTGDTDPHCTRARSRTSEAERRVRQAGCACASSAP